jgi:hypothetical protein
LTHALTALETLKAHRVAVRALVVSESAGSAVDFGATLSVLHRHAAEAPIVAVARDALSIDLDLD